MYPITSIFRTDRGLIPGYGLAPATPGRYEFPTPLIIMSDRLLHTITHVDVVGPAPGLVVSTRRGFYGVREDVYQGEPLFSIDNMPLRLIEPSATTVEHASVIDYAFRAAIVSAPVKLQEVNHRIRNMEFLEIRTRQVSGPEFAKSHMYICDFSKLTTPQTYMWLYHFLVCMFRMRALRMPRHDSTIRLAMNSIWWRDITIMLFKHFAVDFSLEYGSSITVMKFSRTDFRRMLTRLLSVPFKKVVDDFAFVDAVTTKDTVILDENGLVVLDEEHDVPDQTTRTRLRGKYLEYIGLHISFPEIPEFVETNGLIL